MSLQHTYIMTIAFAGGAVYMLTVQASIHVKKEARKEQPFN